MSSAKTLTLGVNDRVTLVEAWRNSDTLWYRLRLTLNSSVQLEYNNTPNGSTNTLYTFTVPVGQEFIGFYILGATYGYC